MVVVADLPVHKGFLAFIHLTVSKYLNGGPGPGIPAKKGVDTTSKADAKACMDMFISKVKWEEVKAIKLYDSTREDGKGTSAFPEGKIPPVPRYLEHIIVPSQENDKSNEEEEDEY